MSVSSDFEARITEVIAQTKKKSTREKKKTKPTTVVVADDAKNEGDDPHWAYEPPEGAVLLDHTVDADAFEWGAIKDDEDTEIWLIRVPDSIKVKHLDGLEIDPPSSPRTARIGGLTKKHATYDVWSIGDDDAEVAGGEELGGLSCLLPRKRKGGRLYVAPKRVSQRLVISAQPPVVTPPDHQPVVPRNPPRPSYPKDVLKHCFIPYGARSMQSLSAELSVDVNDNENTVDISADAISLPKDEPMKSKEPKGKKRKVEGDSPKKSKKHKGNA